MKVMKLNSLLQMALGDHILKDCDLVIDGQNYLYRMYEKSKLSCDAGCESDRFAEFLKSQLGMFKKANVKCYFVFKGASQDVEKRFEKNTHRNTSDYEKSVSIFVKHIWTQVIKEMEFDYVICEMEAKEQCAVLARNLQCPVMSNDVELAILSDLYVNYYFTLKFDPRVKGIRCKLLQFDNFLKRYKLSRDKFSVFLLLAAYDIFPENYFTKVLREIDALKPIPARYEHILNWLSTRSKAEAIDEILKNYEPAERENILLQEQKLLALLTRSSVDIPCQYFLDKDAVTIRENDPEWFEKGIALRYIAIPFIYLYAKGVIDGSKAFKEDSFPDDILLSTDIIKYAANLMHDYREKSFKIYRYNGEIIEVDTTMPDVPKPNYTVNNVVFENGWSRIKQMNLFKHFLSYTMKGVDLDLLRELPEDAKMLMIALNYMARKSSTWGEREAYSVLLSFVALRDRDHSIPDSERRVTDVTFKGYLNEKHVVQKDLVYPLFQFQNCLEFLNYLNALCGYEYQQTDYTRTYNGKLVYNILVKLKDTDIEALELISGLLTSAPNTSLLFQTLVETHQAMWPFNN